MITILKFYLLKRASVIGDVFLRKHQVVFVMFLFFSGLSLCTFAQMKVLDSAVHYVRSGQTREWSAFPANIERNQLTIEFNIQPAQNEYTLSLRQYDVKSDWRLIVNEQDIGALIVDEKEMITYHAVPVGVLRQGHNTLHVRSSSAVSDDIKVGDIRIYSQPLSAVLSEVTVKFNISDDRGKPSPGRITITTNGHVLQTVSARSSNNLAVRPGCVYTGNGTAELSLPAGAYKCYAGRGFEYGIDSIAVEIKPGEHLQKTFTIKREVDTQGWVSCDTHVHTYTHSKHGDATIDERAITIAGEGIEVPILTDHNVHVDLVAAAKRTHVDNYFTAVIGNEVTTKVGHFNVFKINPEEQLIDFSVNSWAELSRKFQDANRKQVVILNHAQDVHSNFRPFGSERHLSSAGISKNSWKLPSNAMEVINSGSQQTHFMELYQNWFGMLNGGADLTPAGSSDSHDVNRFIVGQGRTYVRGNDADPSRINVDEIIENFRAGKVTVSLGLMTKIVVNKLYGPGDLATTEHSATVELEVLGPSWVRADRISLYANGKKIREEAIQASKDVVKWKGTWEIALPKHDVFLVAIAEGPGGGLPFWPIAKPFQPRSIDWTPRLIGSTGAVWIDCDGNKKKDTAHNYATFILSSSNGNIDAILKRLSAFDEAVAMQVAALLWKDGKDLTSTKLSKALHRSSPQIKTGFKRIIEEVNLLK